MIMIEYIYINENSISSLIILFYIIKLKDIKIYWELEKNERKKRDLY